MCAIESIPKSITIKFVMNVVFFRSVLSIRCLFLWSCRCLSPTNLHHYMHMISWRWNRETMSVCFNVFPGQEATASNAFPTPTVLRRWCSGSKTAYREDVWTHDYTTMSFTKHRFSLTSILSLSCETPVPALHYCTQPASNNTLLACTGRLVCVFAVCRFLFEVD